MNAEERRVRGTRTVLIAVLVGLALAGATSFLVFPIITGGRAMAPLLLVHEPRAWLADQPVDVAGGRSVAISGIARHTAPITAVRLNGARLAVDFREDPTTVEFSGFFDRRDVGADGTVEIEVTGVGDLRTTRRFPATVTPEGAAGPGFEEVDRGERSQRWAVVIGAGAFRSGGIAGDPRPGEDARAVASFLRSPAAGLGGFPESHMRVLVDGDATARAIRSGLKTFLRTATPGDLVVVFIAGRVVPDPHRPSRHYLLAHDTEPGDIPATAVDIRDIREALEDVYAHTRVLIADVAASRDGSRAMGALLLDSISARQGGLAVLAPGNGDGVVTATLLDGLRGAADRDRDRTVRLAELLGYVRETVAHQAGPGIALVSATSYDRAWPVAAVPARTALAAPAPDPGR